MECLVAQTKPGGPFEDAVVVVVRELFAGLFGATRASKLVSRRHCAPDEFPSWWAQAMVGHPDNIGLATHVPCMSRCFDHPLAKI